MAYIQQRIIKCPRGHYYDANKYGPCPLCANGAGAAAASIADAVHHAPVTTILKSCSEVTTVLEGDSDDVTMLLESDEKTTIILDEEAEATTILEPTEGVGDAMSASHASSFSAGAQSPKPQRDRDSLAMWSNMNPGRPATSLPMGGNAADANGSHQFSRRAAAVNRGMTVVAGSISTEAVVAPVVGWVVAISGPSRGLDFRIHAAYNYIGREVGDICLSGDMAVSAERDACITFVPQTRSFYLSHEQGRNMLLVNDEPVIGGATKLTSFDVISIGNSKLVFVALCGPEFDWDTGMQSEA